MTETTKTTNLVALDPWGGDYPEGRFRKVHIFDTTDKLDWYLRYPQGLVTVDVEKAREAIEVERTITAYGDITSDDLDAIFHEDGSTWRIWLKCGGLMERTIWALVSDDPRSAEHVAYVERFGEI